MEEWRYKVTDTEIMRKINDLFYNHQAGKKNNWEDELALAYFSSMSIERKYNIAHDFIKYGNDVERSIRKVNYALNLSLPFTDDLFDEREVKE